MSLEIQIKEILENFENSSSEKIIEILEKIRLDLKSQLTSEYLQGKIQKVINAENEAEKKKLCKALTPYLDWYIQGF